MATEACCTCAVLLSDSRVSFESEKPERPPCRLTCCGRSVCPSCISKNPRFSTYCPFCQISTTPSSLPQGLRDPPPYSPPQPAGPPPARQPSPSSPESLPAYSSVPTYQPSSSFTNGDHNPAPDVTHYLHPTDTLPSLALTYSVPQQVLRRHNNLFADHLLHAHKTVSIPGSHYKGGVSLSPRPPDGEEEAERKVKLRKFMVATKCYKYEEGELYLRQAEYQLDRAVEAFREDEKWESENPFERRGKDKQGHGDGRRNRGVAGGLVGQLS